MVIEQLHMNLAKPKIEPVGIFRQSFIKLLIKFLHLLGIIAHQVGDSSSLIPR